MASRGKFSTSNLGQWDPMKSEYETSMQDDDESSPGNLDQCRLYVTNIPRELTENGLRQAFCQYGTLVEVHVSADPTKRYGLVAFETPGEAKLAMMKLNKVEPFNFNINVAFKRTKTQNNLRNNSNSRNHYPRTNKHEENGYNDNNSVSSRGRKTRNDTYQEEMCNDDMNDSDEDLMLEIEKLREAIIKKSLKKKAEKKLISSGSLGSRCMMPDGKIIVRSDNRTNDYNDNHGPGDSWVKLPGLQHDAACVLCGHLAETFCARCGVTPYCSAKCQRVDWPKRHRAVCHNLSPSGNIPDELNHVDVPAVAPLRRPKSPKATTPSSAYDNDGARSTSGRSASKFIPQGHSYDNHRDNKRQEYRNSPQDRLRNDNRDRNQDNRNDNRDRNQDNRNDNRRYHDKPAYQKRDGNKQRQQDNQDENEDWGAKPEQTKPKQEAQTSSYNSHTTPVKKESSEIHKVTSKVESVTLKDVPAKSASVAVKEIVTPSPVKTAEKPLVPAKCVIDILGVDATVLLSVENKDDSGFTCVSLHEDVQDKYVMLCEDYIVSCQADDAEFKPTPGDSFSLYNTEDSAWYRARCLTENSAALLDAGKIVQLAADTKCRRLSGVYAEIVEFCCILSDAGVNIGDNLKATIVSKLESGCKVSLCDVTTEGSVGEGALKRWLPKVEYPKPVAKPTGPVPIPEVCRPEVKDKMEVLIVDISKDIIFVRPADDVNRRKFDMIEQEVVLYGREASPLKEAPTQGSIVVAEYIDGMHFRALVKRTNTKQNKYLLEYLEYGNTEISQLEKLYPCPSSLSLDSHPVITSFVKLHGVSNTLNNHSTEYLEKIKVEEGVLVLSLPGGSKTAASGSEVILSVSKNNENINNKLEEMSKPEWKKMEEQKVDVLESPVLMLKDVKYVPLSDGELIILDSSMLHGGVLSVCPKLEAEKLHTQLEQLTVKITEYCESEIGRLPYLPRHEEVCIAKFPPYEQWFRAVLCDQEEGAGGTEASILYLDYGNMEQVPVNVLRKCLPTFLELPALASTAEVADFPKNPTPEQLKKAREFLQLGEDGSGGVLPVTKCTNAEPGSYVVTAPGLIAAMMQKI